jgi:hypothetical protein
MHILCRIHTADCRQLFVECVTSQIVPVESSEPKALHVAIFSGPMRVVLICHHDAPLHRDGIARWVASWATLAGTVVVHEPRNLLVRRARREWRRSGLVGLLDVLAFRLYYRLFLSTTDQRGRAQQLEVLRERYAPAPAETPQFITSSPNASEAREFIAARNPDLMIALCKNILAEKVFALPKLGTFVLHPGICPEYRNAHGCFWALAQRDLGNVGLTLLRIDKGIDTGPAFAYFRAPYDECIESHCIIQDRMLLHNLEAIRDCFLGIAAGCMEPISAAGRRSGEWGQPRLTRYLRWKRAARLAVQAQPSPASS